MGGRPLDNLTNDLANDIDDIGAAVHIYVQEGGLWRLDAQINATSVSNHDPDDYFGLSVAISDGKIVVGAPRTGSSWCGKAYTFERNCSLVWEETFSLATEYGTGLGLGVAISRDTVLVGAPFANESTGFVYAIPQEGLPCVAE